MAKAWLLEETVRFVRGRVTERIRAHPFIKLRVSELSMADTTLDQFSSIQQAKHFRVWRSERKQG
jgi:hypothetical protein